MPPLAGAFAAQGAWEAPAGAVMRHRFWRSEAHGGGAAASEQAAPRGPAAVWSEGVGGEPWSPLIRSERRPSSGALLEEYAEAPFDRDCRFGQWGHWGPCSRNCSQGAEHGKRRRSREILQESRGRGKECHEGMVQDEPCNLFQCEEACKWDQWTEWSGCRCNVTVEHRNRTLKAYASGGVDMTCNLDDGTDTRSCPFKPCPVNCEWHDWGGWSDCDKHCGGGWTHRKRLKTPEMYGGAECAGEPVEELKCNLQACDVDCAWSPWSSSECNVTCGGGVRERTRTIDTPQSGNGAMCEGPAALQQVCNDFECPVDCVWGSWEPWGDCSKTCHVGSRNRTRGVLETASHGGAACDPGGVEFQDCNEAIRCPIDCVWQDWETWTSCSVVCGEGVRSRARPYIQEEHGGRPCSDADSTQLEKCHGHGEHCPKEEAVIEEGFQGGHGGASPLGAHHDGILGTVLVEVERAQEFAGYCSHVLAEAMLNEKACALKNAIADALRLSIQRRWIEQHGMTVAFPMDFAIEVATVLEPTGQHSGSAAEDRMALAEAPKDGPTGNVSVHFDIPHPPHEAFEVVWTVSGERLREDLNHELTGHELARFRVLKVLGFFERHVDRGGTLFVHRPTAPTTKPPAPPPPPPPHTPAPMTKPPPPQHAQAAPAQTGHSGILSAAKALGQTFVGEVNAIRAAFQDGRPEAPTATPAPGSLAQRSGQARQRAPLGAAAGLRP